MSARGGFQVLYDRGEERRMFAVALKHAGCQTDDYLRPGVPAIIHRAPAGARPGATASCTTPD
jgi:hypothetical protein